MPELIPLDRATAALWPHSADDPRLHLRILDGDPSQAQRDWIAKRGGRFTILDPTGSGDARLFWTGLGRDTGWHNADEINAEFAKLDAPLGEHMRQILAALGKAA